MDEILQDIRRMIAEDDEAGSQEAPRHHGGVDAQEAREAHISKVKARNERELAFFLLGHLRDDADMLDQEKTLRLIRLIRDNGGASHNGKGTSLGEVLERRLIDCMLKEKFPSIPTVRKTLRQFIADGTIRAFFSPARGKGMAPHSPAR